VSTFALSFEAEVVDEQTLLNGTRYVSIEGASESDAGSWTLALNFAEPKESGAALDEGDLVLSGPEGSIVAGLESGETAIVMDDSGEDEQRRLDLSLAVTDGEGGYAGATGEVRLCGVLVGGSGHLDATLSLATEPEAPADGQSDGKDA
jgi:hypothetical protein